MNTAPNKAPRGIRLNNPGNIRFSNSDAWIGQSRSQHDRSFITFDDPIYGLRAIGRILRTYNKHRQIRSIATIINRWAPNVENPTEKYIQFVAERCGCTSETEVDFTSPRLREIQFIQALIHFENGQQPYSQEIIFGGLILASADLEAYNEKY